MPQILQLYYMQPESSPGRRGGLWVQPHTVEGSGCCTPLPPGSFGGVREGLRIPRCQRHRDLRPRQSPCAYYKPSRPAPSVFPRLHNFVPKRHVSLVGPETSRCDTVRGTLGARLRLQKRFRGWSRPLPFLPISPTAGIRQGRLSSCTS